MANVYYEPEKHGLEVVAEIDFSDRSYQFDTRVVWRHKETGVLYTGRDAGCSCPSPFEDYHDLASLEVVNLESLRQEVESETTYTTIPERVAFLDAVKAALKGAS